MAYSFAEVEQALARMYFIKSASRSAFANRLKHLQRKGFPEGLNTGRGRAADYQAEHLIQLALALELMTFGYTPERAISAINSSQSNLAAGVLRATDFEETIICNFTPQGLSELQGGKICFDGPEGPEAPLRCMTAAEAINGIGSITDFQSAGVRVALFSLSGIASLCANMIGWDDETHNRPEFYEQLNIWAKRIIDGDT